MTSVSEKQYFIHIVCVILCIWNQNLECAFNHKIHLKISMKFWLKLMDFKCKINASSIAAVLMKCQPVVVFSNRFVINMRKTNIAVTQNQKSNHFILMGHFSWTMQLLMISNVLNPWYHRSFCSGIIFKYTCMYLRDIWAHA